MADAKPTQSGNKYEIKKKEKKKKKEKTKIALPNTRQMFRRQKAVGQAKASHQDTHALIGTAIVVLLVLFILFGGINQRRFVITSYNWSTKIGEFISSLFSTVEPEITEDGIYLNPVEESVESTPTEGDKK